MVKNTIQYEDLVEKVKSVLKNSDGNPDAAVNFLDRTVNENPDTPGGH